MWDNEDMALQEQKALNEAKKEEVVGWLWQKQGMLFFKGVNEPDTEKRYVGALRTKKKTMTKQMALRLMQGERFIVRYEKEKGGEE